MIAWAPARPVQLFLPDRCQGPSNPGLVSSVKILSIHEPWSGRANGLFASTPCHLESPILVPFCSFCLCFDISALPLRFTSANHKSTMDAQHEFLLQIRSGDNQRAAGEVPSATTGSRSSLQCLLRDPPPFPEAWPLLLSTLTVSLAQACPPVQRQSLVTMCSNSAWKLSHMHLLPWP